MIDGTAPGGSASAALGALAAARRCGLDLADELLTHLPDVGDPATQRLVDQWVEQAADTLRAVAEVMEDRLLEVGRAPAEAPRTTRPAP